MYFHNNAQEEEGEVKDSKKPFEACCLLVGKYLQDIFIHVTSFSYPETSEEQTNVLEEIMWLAYDNNFIMKNYAVHRHVQS